MEWEINPPIGYEIDQKKSSFEKLVFKPIKKNFQKIGENWILILQCLVLKN